MVAGLEGRAKFLDIKGKKSSPSGGSLSPKKNLFQERKHRKLKPLRNYSGARSQNSEARMKREPTKGFSRLDCLAKGSSICFIQISS
jgi:hypothetical protein